MLDRTSKRRAFHLANLSAKLALISERLADQATALADAALELTDEIHEPAINSIQTPNKKSLEPAGE